MAAQVPVILEVWGRLCDGKEISDVNAYHGVSDFGKASEIAGEKPPIDAFEEQAWFFA